MVTGHEHRTTREADIGRDTRAAVRARLDEEHTASAGLNLPETPAHRHLVVAGHEDIAVGDSDGRAGVRRRQVCEMTVPPAPLQASRAGLQSSISPFGSGSQKLAMKPTT